MSRASSYRKAKAKRLKALAKSLAAGLTDWKGLYVEAISNGLSPSAALAACKVSRSTVQATRDMDPVFKAALASAYKAAREEAVAELYRRAVKGWKEPVYQNGKKVGVKRKYSDRLLVEWVRAHEPKFRREAKVTNLTIHEHRERVMNVLASPEAVALQCRLDAALSSGSLEVPADSRGIEFMQTVPDRPSSPKEEVASPNDAK